ncbi:MAG TPA: protein kinase [Kofleriaceae bacterium]|nr:protein kinase [Kofleriaceae bacterium]
MTTASITCTGCKHAYADTALFCPNCGRPKVREVVSDPLLGKLLGERFQVQEQIGQGASGTIYRAEHVTLRRRVAIKVLHAELSRDDLAVERFRREATTVAEIDNEHIVEIHDFGRTPDGRLYLAMELLEGETLDTVLAHDPAGQLKTLSVERAADVLIQVGEALMEAHAIGYVHRDLRPRNVYLAVRRGKANFVKLLDFGLSKLVETDSQAASTSLGMTFGDPRYMSPEQARGDRIDRRADIYQLGCVAYEMLTGAPPFTGNRVFDILTKQVTEIPEPLPTRRPGVPLWMEAAVAKMLAKDPENRFATTTRMVEALRRGLDTGEVMEDEIARRRESIPPPSVSRVMQKMGMTAPAEYERLPERVAIPVPAPPPPPPQHPLIAAQVQPVAERRRTNTPDLGVPIMPPATARGPAPTVVGPAPGPIPAEVAGAIERPTAPIAVTPVVPTHSAPTIIEAPAVKLEPVVEAKLEPKPPVVEAAAAPAGRARRESAQGGPTESSTWFDEGEQASKNADDRKSLSTSVIDLPNFDEPEPRTRRLWPAAIVVLGLLGAAGAAVAIFAGGSRGSESAKVVQIDTPPAPAAPVIPANVPESTIIAAPGSATPAPAPTPPPVVATPTPTPTPTPAPAPAKLAPKDLVVTTPTNTHSHDHDRTNSGPDFNLGVDDDSRRHPQPTATPKPPTPTVAITPPAPKTGVSGGDVPVDPYNSTPATTDSGDGDKKAEFYANMGEQQLASSDTAGAAASFQKAAQLDPKNVAAAMGMGEIALRQGLFGDAISHLKRAARLSPKNSKVYTLLGEAYLNSGQNAIAADNFKKALQLDPDNTRAREGYNDASSKVPPPSDDE